MTTLWSVATGYHTGKLVSPPCLTCKINSLTIEKKNQIKNPETGHVSFFRWTKICPCNSWRPGRNLIFCIYIETPMNWLDCGYFTFRESSDSFKSRRQWTLSGIVVALIIVMKLHREGGWNSGSRTTHDFWRSARTAIFFPSGGATFSCFFSPLYSFSWIRYITPEKRSIISCVARVSNVEL